VALRAATDPEGFRTDVVAGAPDVTAAVDAAAAAGAATSPPELLARWRTSRAALASALTALPPGTTLPWFGPDMSAPSLATARLMETWAHGVDVRDALDRPIPATSRLRAVAHLGVRTRGFAFRQHSLTPPAAEVRVELTGPDGEVWTWGPPKRPSRSLGRPSTSACGSPSAGTATTSPSRPWAPTPNGGWTWPRPSPAHPERADRRAPRPRLPRRRRSPCGADRVGPAQQREAADRLDQALRC
jgi:uncharacterized protein (TIGR03083 family)